MADVGALQRSVLTTQPITYNDSASWYVWAPANQLGPQMLNISQEQQLINALAIKLN